MQPHMIILAQQAEAIIILPYQQKKHQRVIIWAPAAASYNHIGNKKEAVSCYYISTTSSSILSYENYYHTRSSTPRMANGGSAFSVRKWKTLNSLNWLTFASVCLLLPRVDVHTRHWDSNQSLEGCRVHAVCCRNTPPILQPLFRILTSGLIVRLFGIRIGRGKDSGDIEDDNERKNEKKKS
jgi:hypothetical protein